MLVKMLSTRKGAQNNIDVQLYEKDKPYEVSGELLDVFLREGWCEAAEPFREGKGDGEAKGDAATGGDGDTDTTVPPGDAEKELVVGEAEVLAKHTRDELLDLAEEQGIEVPADVVKKADVVKFLAGKLKVTVE